jgi:hypothetical protein
LGFILEQISLISLKSKKFKDGIFWESVECFDICRLKNLKNHKAMVRILFLMMVPFGCFYFEK